MARGAAWIGGVELFSQARTLAYIRAGLAGPYVTAGACDCCEFQAYSLAGAPLAYSRPSLDGAPWYSPGDVASGEFLGFLVSIGGMDSTLTRSVTTVASSRGGGRLGRVAPKERTITVTGYMVASSERGQDYGMRWLTSVLAFPGPGCRNCGLEDMVLQLYCPDDPAGLCESRWTLRDVGVVAGPTLSQENSGCTELRAFDLTLTSEHPYLYSYCEPPCQPQVFAGATTQAADDAAPCLPICDWLGLIAPGGCELVPPSPPDDLAAVVTVFTGGREVSFDLTGTAGTCPPSGAARDVVIPFRQVPAGTTITFDSAAERITAVLPDGQVVDGFRFVALGVDTPFDWLSLQCGGDPMCVRVEALAGSVGGAMTVEIESVRRRL